MLSRCKDAPRKNRALLEKFSRKVRKISSGTEGKGENSCLASFRVCGLCTHTTGTTKGPWTCRGSRDWTSRASVSTLAIAVMGLIIRISVRSHDRRGIQTGTTGVWLVFTSVSSKLINELGDDWLLLTCMVVSNDLQTYNDTPK